MRLTFPQLIAKLEAMITEDSKRRDNLVNLSHRTYLDGQINGFRIVIQTLNNHRRSK